MSLRRGNLPVGCVRPVSSGSSSSASDLPTATSISQQANLTAPRSRKPPPLRLPFEDRKRESRLVSDEDLDEIMSQATATPHTTSSEPPRFKRSMSNSTAAPKRLKKQRKRWSLVGPPVKHESPGFSSFLSSPSLKREPESLTALPRPPTKNNMAVYADDLPANYGTPAKADALLGRNHTPITPSTPASTAIPAVRGQHKRSFSTSAASFVDTVKKRLQTPKEPKFDNIQPQASKNDSPSSSSRLAARNSWIASNSTTTTCQTPLPSSRRESIGSKSSPSNRIQTIENFMHLEPLHRRLKHQFQKRTPTRTYMNDVIAADRQQISDLRLQNSMIMDNANELRKDWIQAEEKLEMERHKSFGLECEVFRLKCEIEKLETEKKRIARGSSVS